MMRLIDNYLVLVHIHNSPGCRKHTEKYFFILTYITIICTPQIRNTKQKILDMLRYNIKYIQTPKIKKCIKNIHKSIFFAAT